MILEFTRNMYVVLVIVKVNVIIIELPYEISLDSIDTTE